MYTVIRSETTHINSQPFWDDFNQAVIEKMADNWIPQGGVSMLAHPNKNNTTIVIQAMTSVF